MTQPGDERLLNAVSDVAREEHVQLMSQDLGGAAFTELSDAELQMLAGAVSEQLVREPPARQKRPAQRAQGLAQRLRWLAAAAALFGGGLWLMQRLPPDREQQTASAPPASTDRQLALPDGSTLALGEQTEARVVKLDPREVRVQLERGSVECEVAHNPERRFVVATGALEVVVKGTRFTVSSGLEATAPEHVVVSVERGLVEVRQPPDRVLALLGPGQRWSSDGRTTPPAAWSAAPAPTASQPAPAALRPSPLPEAAPSQRGDPATAPMPRQRPAPSARQLFERADAERLAGRAREAAEAFDELRRRHPSDARAGYAAFMLGRIRLDSLADPGGAVEAFEFAIAHAATEAKAESTGFFLEDAAARRVEALDKAGRSRDCRAAREQFLLQYPKAVRAPLVAKLCAR